MELSAVARRCRSILVISLLAFVACAPVRANMVLSNVILHFEAGEPTRQDIEIENIGDESLYVDVRPHVVEHPGTGQERRVFIADPREAGLLVTPNKLVVPPGGRKLVRFVDLKPGHSEERVYRVAVTPVTGELEARASGLKILVGYEVLVLAQPAAPNPQLNGQRDGRSMTFRNDGNTNVMLREGRQCATDDTPVDDCQVLGARRLYPGNEWMVELPYDRPLEYYIGIGTRSTVERWQ
ncbi:MAG: hypothetical protein KJO82_04425 [Gammaproteobacteria bacterium]|nr:hypothetical protein [Gammaproteobacteria bacterium]